MQETIHELKEIIEKFSADFSGQDTSTMQAKPFADKWSKKEVIGHLIDSAHTNLRRFLVGQYDNKYPIRYDQNFWVKANNYQETSLSEIILFWKLINERICSVLKNMPVENYIKVVNTGTEKTPEMHSLQWLAQDYVKHLKHHINQVIPGSFHVSYP